MKDEEYNINGDYSGCIAFTSQFYFCSIPLRLDTYQGCGHQCKYCFANLRSGKNFEKDRTKNYSIAKPETVERYMEKAVNEKETANIEVNAIKQGIPFHWGGMADPFPPIEKKHGISLKVAKILEEYNYPCVISTKGKAFLEEKYLKQFSKNKCLVQFSIMNNNPRVIKKVEPGASTLDERKQQIKLLKEIGLPVGIRLQPLIPIYFDWDKYIEMVNDLEVKYVTIEHLKLPLEEEKIKAISNIYKFDIKKEFKKISGNLEPVKVYGREFELPGAVKYRILIANGIKQKFNDAGIKVGMGDNQLHQFNDGECCCGVDTLTDFNIYKANYTSMFKRKYDNYKYTDLIDNLLIPKGVVNVNSNSRPGDGSKATIINLLKWKWEHPRLNDSPSDTFNLVSDKVGRETIYHWSTCKQEVLF